MIDVPFNFRDKDGVTRYVLVLDDYERINLNWYLRLALGGVDFLPVAPFEMANNGDWIGQIANMLEPRGSLSSWDEIHEHTNADPADVKRAIQELRGFGSAASDRMRSLAMELVINAKNHDRKELVAEAERLLETIRKFRREQLESSLPERG